MFSNGVGKVSLIDKEIRSESFHRFNFNFDCSTTTDTILLGVEHVHEIIQKRELNHSHQYQ